MKQNPSLQTALQHLNDAAYTAVRSAVRSGASNDAISALQSIARATDAQVDAAAPGVEVEA